MRCIPKIGMLALVVGLTLSAAAAQDAKQGKFELSKEEQEVVELTNKTRQKEDLKALKVNPKLCEVARAYSAKMAKQKKLDHFLDDTKVGQRVKAAGYYYFFIGENLGAGNFPVAKIFQAWMDSKKHRENILHARPTEIGIGIFRDDEGTLWYTQLFGAPKPAPPGQ